MCSLGNLQALKLSAANTSGLNVSVDRMLAILVNNPRLKSLDVHLQMHEPVLPVERTEMKHLENLNLAGGAAYETFMNALVLPVLKIVALDIEAKEVLIDNVLSELYERSGQPPVHTLKFSWVSSATSHPYHSPHSSQPNGFPTRFIEKTRDSLKALAIAKGVADVILAELLPEEGDVACPRLTSLTFKQCHSHSDSVAKLIKIVEMRNPGGTTGTGFLSRLTKLMWSESGPLGSDVLEWLRERVDEVKYVEGHPQP